MVHLTPPIATRLGALDLVQRLFASSTTLHACHPGPRRRLQRVPLFLLPRDGGRRHRHVPLKKLSSKNDIADLMEREEQAEAQRRIPQALRWARQDRDEGIQERMVVMIDRSTNSLGRPMPLAQKLREMDRDTEFLIRVGSAGEGAGAPALCKVLPKKEVFAKEQAREKQVADSRKAEKHWQGKTLEMGWAVAGGDLEHRLRRARGFLEKGERVSFVIEKRQRRTVVDPAAAAELLAHIRAAMKDVPGTTEMPKEGTPGKKMVLAFAPPK